MANQRGTIGRALVLIVCACSIPAVIAAVAAVVYHFHYARDGIVTSSVRRAASISAAVDTTVTNIETGLLTLSMSSHLLSGDLRSLYLQARSVLPLLDDSSSIYLADASGNLLFNTLEPFGATLPRSANPELVRQVVASGRPQVSDLFVGAISHRPIVAVAVPVIRDSKVVMVLAATLASSSIQKLLQRQGAPTNWVISVHDSGMRFISRSHDFARFVGQLPSRDLQDAMLDQPVGTVDGRTCEGIAVLAAYTRSGLTGWSVSVGIPKEELLHRLDLSIAAVGAVLALIVGAGLLAAALAARSIRTAIAALVPAADALSRSEPFKFVAAGGIAYRETDKLGLALEHASEHLRRSEYRAQHDVLTGLPNRAFKRTILPRLQSQTLRNRTSLALLYLDLDGFKFVNDTLGHAVGDEVLFQAAERIRAAIRDADIGFRLGGDEFAVVLPDTGRAGAGMIAAQLCAALRTRFTTSQGPARVSVSIGVAVFPDDCSCVDDLVKLADAAMYRAKRQGKNTVCTAEDMLEPDRCAGA